MYGLFEAKKVAEKYVDIFKPYCSRVEIAGSIRREKPEVKDIEIVCLQKSAHLEQYFIENQSKWRFGKNGFKYKEIYLDELIKLDLFICTEKTWAMNYLIRTGSANYIKSVMISLRKRGYKCIDAQLYKFEDGCCCCEEDLKYPIDLKDEQDFYNETGIIYIHPRLRV